VARSHPAAHVEAVDVRQRQVEHDEVDAAGTHSVEGGLSCLHVLDGETLPFQRAYQGPGDGEIVLDEQQVLHSRSRRSCSAARFWLITMMGAA
jgi:hypothetical protein